MNSNSTVEARAIFKRSSTTYYFSSIFFPEPYRSAIVTLYAFVRTADNFVDQITPDVAGFRTFVQLTWQVWKSADNQPSQHHDFDQIIRDFVSLAQEYNIERGWVEAFFASMKLDLDKKNYDTIEETVTYMYGSAEVIGLMIARIFTLPDEAERTARLLGRAMQFINMIRDVSEDKKLDRQYVPTVDQRIAGLHDLSEQGAQNQPEEFSTLIRFELQRQQHWMEAAREGFHFLPRSLRIPVKTASDMFDWTAAEISKNPHIIWQRIVKPSRWQVIGRALWLWLKLS